VQTFDLTPDNTLHLTHHLFEEQDRNRGPSLIHLSEFFKSSGYEPVENELPDYLPLLLEYVSTLEDSLSARFFLRELNPAVVAIAENLEKISSPYAPLLRLIERHGQTVATALTATI
jgi:nitrate reductase delta subunit